MGRGNSNSTVHGSMDFMVGFMVLSILLNLDKVKRIIEITTSLCNVEYVI